MLVPVASVSGVFDSLIFRVLLSYLTATVILERRTRITTRSMKKTRKKKLYSLFDFFPVGWG